MPVYSIIVPVYNAEKYLESCIDSVLSQSSDKTYEVILVDDGSTDHSPELCDRYAKQSSNVRVIHQANQGVSAARNAGIAASRGEYILFLDSDDLWRADLLKEVSAVLTKTPDMVIFGYQEFGSSEAGQESLPDTFEQEQTGLSYFKHYEKRSVMPIINCWAAAFRRTFLIENQIVFPHDIGYGEDFVFHMYALKAAASIVTIPAALYYYRMNEASITHTPTGKKIYEMLTACANMYRLFPSAMLADYYCMQILWLSYLSRDDAIQLKPILQKNRDIQYAVSGRKPRLASFLYDVLGWYGGARAVRFVLELRHSGKSRSTMK